MSSSVLLRLAPFMLLQMALFHSFFMTDIPLCVCVCVCVHIYHIFFVHLSAMIAYDLAIVSSATLNIGVRISFQIWFFIFSEYMQECIYSQPDLRLPSLPSQDCSSRSSCPNVAGKTHQRLELRVTTARLASSSRGSSSFASSLQAGLKP